MQPMTMGFQNSGKRLQYAVESRECARRVRRFSKLSKRRPLAYALAVVIATVFVGMLLSGYGPVAIYRAGGADGVAVRDTRSPPFKTDGAHETKLAARGAVSKTPSRGFDAKTDLGAHGTPAAQSAAEASVLAKDRGSSSTPTSSRRRRTSRSSSRRRFAAATRSRRPCSPSTRPRHCRTCRRLI